MTISSAYEKLEAHRRVWNEKPLLREVYKRWYMKIEEFMPENGQVLEIGGGGGNLKEHCSHVISSDYIFCPWLDITLDAHYLPFRKGSLECIAAIDVLHHLHDPVKFLREAVRVLSVHGRIILLEPYISLWSWPVYRFVHPEDVDFSIDLFSKPESTSGEKDPFEGNMAIAAKLFMKDRRRLEEAVPELRLHHIEWSDFLLYPLSGGFESPALCPMWLVPVIKRMENLLLPASRLLGYRMMVVLEKCRQGG